MFPQKENVRIQGAAALLRLEVLIKPILLGDERVIATFAENNFGLSGVEIGDPLQLLLTRAWGKCCALVARRKGKTDAETKWLH